MTANLDNEVTVAVERLRARAKERYRTPESSDEWKAATLLTTLSAERERLVEAGGDLWAAIDWHLNDKRSTEAGEAILRAHTKMFEALGGSVSEDRALTPKDKS